MHLVKKLDGSYIPANDSDYELSKKVGAGEIVKATKSRNYEFHKKIWALFKLGFDNWNPTIVETEWGTPKKSFDRFRKDMIIRAGYYELTVNTKGEVKAEAESMSYENMGAEKFQRLYDDVLILIGELLETSPEDIQSELQNYY